MYRRRQSRRIWLLPLVFLTFGGFVFIAPRFAEGLTQTSQIHVVDGQTGRPISGAAVTVGDHIVVTSGDGLIELSGLDKARKIKIQASGYADVEVASYAGSVEMKPLGVFGVVSDRQSGQPVGLATVYTDAGSVRVGQDGDFKLPNVNPGTRISVKAPGFERYVGYTSKNGKTDIQLTPLTIHAIYISAATLGFPAQRSRLFDLVRSTELNAVVMDFKSERGYLTFASKNALADQIDATPTDPPDAEAMLAELKRANIYTIARIVTFKDKVLANAKPNLALKNGSGRLFVDPEGQNWVDPFQKDVRDYNISLAEEAAAMGFDEVQFDFARFPTEGKIDDIAYSEPSTSASRRAAINGFFKDAAARLLPTGTFVSTDVFGYGVWNDGELGIGQQIDELASIVDYLSPMLYPSTFGIGIPGVGDRAYAVGNPGEVVRLSLEQSRGRTKSDGKNIRPWLQYFDDYSYQTGRKYSAEDIEAQKRAARAAGTRGWMLWDPTNLYTKGGIGAPQ